MCESDDVDESIGRGADCVSVMFSVMPITVEESIGRGAESVRNVSSLLPLTLFTIGSLGLVIVRSCVRLIGLEVCGWLLDVGG